MGDANGWTLIFAFWAVVATVYAGWEQRQNNKLQARIVELEEARERDRVASQRRANVTAAYVLDTVHGNRRHLLRIANAGPGTADSIVGTSDGVRLDINQHVYRAAPLGRLGPGAWQDSVLVVTGNGPPPQFDVEVRWVDESGPGLVRTQIAV